jgi:hypothetical protein
LLPLIVILASSTSTQSINDGAHLANGLLRRPARLPP